MAPLFRGLSKQFYSRRTFWAWVNMKFNEVDETRLKAVGAELACAEWVLRNGGAVRWAGSDRPLADFNQLAAQPPGRRLAEILATDSSVSHYGFPHLKGCKYIEKIILDNCKYIDDTAILGLSHVESPLRYFQISNCSNITDRGLSNIPAIRTLEVILLYNLISVKDMNGCVESIRNRMPGCEIKLQKET